MTASTMVNALGFESLKAEKEHIYVFVKGRPAKDVNPEVQKYLDFGIANGIHSVSTLVGCIMPVLLPPPLLYLLGMWTSIHSWSLKEKSH